MTDTPPSSEKLMVALRDGRKLLGVLRSWDQFANLVLQSTVERTFVPPEAVPADHPSAAEQRGLYADIPRGVFIVRGENVMLLGEIDLDKDDDAPPGYDQADPDLVEKLAKERKEADKVKDKKKQKNLSVLGFEGESMGDIIL
ncbi:U6 snRNA-associated Sm-like protein LSm1 [Cytospora mali]|uniref:U6 snRNA-associated Sm-like protein LSm1 n=1 Tax=Cytospora mali TaxID=578113 RepID=A0A194WD47_CYTMA|nr:U6 snRNA-associated Sm-like protein LSm1 [Valsa mali]